MADKAAADHTRQLRSLGGRRLSRASGGIVSSRSSSGIPAPPARPHGKQANSIASAFVRQCLCDVVCGLQFNIPESHNLPTNRASANERQRPTPDTVTNRSGNHLHRIGVNPETAVVPFCSTSRAKTRPDRRTPEANSHSRARHIWGETNLSRSSKIGGGHRLRRLSMRGRRNVGECCGGRGQDRGDAVRRVISGHCSTTLRGHGANDSGRTPVAGFLSWWHRWNCVVRAGDFGGRSFLAEQRSGHALQSLL